MFGPKYATTNTSLLYTAKGLSAFVVPLANILKSHTGNWHAVFFVAAIMNFIVVAMALFVVRPMRISISASETQERGRTRPPGGMTACSRQSVRHGRQTITFPTTAKGAPRCAFFFARRRSRHRHTTGRFTRLRCPQARRCEAISNRRKVNITAYFFDFDISTFVARSN